MDDPSSLQAHSIETRSAYLTDRLSVFIGDERKAGRVVTYSAPDCQSVARDLAELHWVLIENVVRPHLCPTENPELFHRVDRHKIAATHEYGVMKRMPLMYEDDEAAAFWNRCAGNPDAPFPPGVRRCNAMFALHLALDVISTFSGLDAKVIGQEYPTFLRERLVWLQSVNLEHPGCDWIFLSSQVWWAVEQLMKRHQSADVDAEETTIIRRPS